MKLDVATTDIVLSNVGTTGEFRIRNSAKAFKILSDGLYSNKIRAVIRELSCNAVDSHIAAKQPKPFEVHLPNVYEPWFSVKDFGLGLDDCQVTNIYTTYFESTKTDSNDFIGALGLGSKSPFSYTDNFTITAIKNGTQYIYSAFINESGVPSVAEMGKELTDQPNGVEVKFSVSDCSDYSSFRYEAQEVFKWFKIPPTILGSSDYRITATVYREVNIIPGVHHLQTTGHYSQNSIAIMGNIPYSMNKIAEPAKHFGNLASLLDCGLVIEFDIGELDFAASREELSIVPITIASIKHKLEALNAHLSIHIATKADAITDMWERAGFLQKEMQENAKMYGAAIKKYVADTSFPLFDPTATYGKKTFDVSELDLEARGLSFAIFSRNHKGENRTVLPYTKHHGTPVARYYSIPVQSDIVFVLNDLTTGCAARARYHYSEVGGSPTVICVSHTSGDLAERQAEYDKLLAEFCNPPVVLKASELTKRVRVANIKSNNGIAVLYEKSSTRQYYLTKEYGWSTVAGELSGTETYYYVRLDGHKSTDLSGNATIPVASIKQQMIACGIPDIANITIYGVRKSRFKEISELTNWVWLEDKLREETAKITDTHITGMVAASMFDHYSNAVYTSKDIAKLVDKNSDYRVYVNTLGDIQKSSGDVKNLISLCAMYGKTVQVDIVKKNIESGKEQLSKKYPLLKHLYNASGADTAEYIKLVDRS